MRRRNFLTGVGVAGASLTAATRTATATVDADADNLLPAAAPARAAETVPALYFDSTTALLNADGEPLTDDSLVPVYAMDTARVVDQDGMGDATTYGDAAIALVAADTDLGGGVYGFGCPFVTDEADFSYGNEEFLLNLWSEAMGEGTVLWDGGHGQYYALQKFGKFEGYAETNGFTVEATTDLQADLEGAAGVVITSPTGSFSAAEKEALSAFVEDGGSVFLHSQSDYDDYDETDNLNALCESLGAGFRFNDAQVMDEKHSAGPPYIVTTENFTTSFPYFTPRRGMNAGPRFSVDETYEATVEAVYDGDTVSVTIDGSTEEVRILGVDTPEKADAADAETPYEWPGLGGEPDGDYPTLVEGAQAATAFAREELAGETVTLSFAENEGISDPYGRLLCLVRYDADGSGSNDTLYEERLLAGGHARAFHSDLGIHDRLLHEELTARASDTGLWAESTPGDSASFRNEDVSQLFVPRPLAVTGQGDLADDQVLVRAEESANQAGAPLAAVDRDNRVAVVGGLLANDAYERDGFAGDAAAYGNYPFLTNLLTALSAKDGGVLIAGGHGQFGASGAVTTEATSWYQRHLEGEGIDLNGVNDLANADDLLADARSVVVTSPASAYSQADLDALVAFRDSGGSVVLLGSAAASQAAAVNLNSVARALGSDLSVGLTAVTDAESNVAGKAGLVATRNFDADASVFAAYDGNASLSTATTTETATATPEDGTTTDAATETSGPGFGTLTGLAGVAGGVATVLRSRLGSGE